MIYIVGHKFTFNPGVRQQSSGLSIQEQLALSKRNSIPTKSASPFDARFVIGNVYRVAAIRKKIEENEQKVVYLFVNDSNTTCPDIDITLKDTSHGDEYIAAISGSMADLQSQRSAITQAALNNTEL
jgi:hypothetical protein